MKFSTILFTAAAFAAGALADGNLMTFISQDDLDRNIVCTPQAGQQEIPSFLLKAGASADQEFPEAWIGNCHGVIDGQEDTGNGMLAEVAWGGFIGATFFDVSAIVNDTDVNNIQMMTPAQSDTPSSGCQGGMSTCAFVYRLPDDIQTQSTPETHLLVYVGVPSTPPTSSTRRRGPVRRSFVLGEETL